MLTDQTPINTIAEKTNADLGIREGQPIGCKVTLRDEKADDFLEKAFWVKEDLILERNIDEYESVDVIPPDFWYLDSNFIRRTEEESEYRIWNCGYLNYKKK